MRCPDCNKFVPLNTDEDPEVDLYIDAGTGEVTGTVRIVNACQECGAELTEATFDVDLDFEEAGDHISEQDPEKGDCTLELEEPEITRTEHQEGRGRGTKTFYGAEGDITVKCSCGKTWTKSWQDSSQASHMDQLN